MDKRKNFIRWGALCAALLLCGMAVLPVAVPVSAAADGAMDNEYVSPYSLSFGWLAQDSTASLSYQYTRELPFAFSSGSANMSFYGPALDGTGSTHQVCSYWCSVTTGTPNKAEQTLGFADEVAILTFFQERPMFVSQSKGLPLLSIGDVDSNMDVTVQVKGYWIVRSSNVETGKFTQVLEPFALTLSGTAESEELFVCSNVLTASNMTYDAVVTSLTVSCNSAEVANGYYLQNVRCTMAVWNATEYSENLYALQDALSADFQAVGETDLNVDFTAWLTTAIGGFWTFELVPGITVEGIVYACLGLGLLVMFIKYFAGG